MAKLRNRTTDALYVPCVDARVEPDEVIEIPDETYRAYVWPDTVWTAVDVTLAKRIKKSEG
jgi:hypothetical protein